MTIAETTSNIPQAPNVQDSSTNEPTEASTTEVSTTPNTPEPSDPPKPISESFSALARKERELRQKEEEYNSKYSELEKLQGLDQKLKENPLLLLEEFGIEYKDILQSYLDKNNPQEVNELEVLRSEIDQLKNNLQKKSEDEEKATLEQTKQTYINKITEFKNFAESEIKKDNEKYELINSLGKHSEVFEIIQNHFFETNQLLDFHAVAEAVEEELEKYVETLTKTNKVKKRFSPRDTGQQGNDKNPTSDKEKTINKILEKSPTLQNTSFQFSGQPEENKPLSKDEALKKASAIMSGAIT